MAERKPKTEPSTLNFEKSLRQLETIVKRLEDEELPLDQALKLFAEGQGLARVCETQLRSAENQVRTLLETPAGEIVEKKFEADSMSNIETPENSLQPDSENKNSAAQQKKSALTQAEDDLPF